ncbi:ATP-binding protein [Streptomyces sp. NPDC057702]|uniref:ATP-binding protein n=1 Tax=unclassified Streptomyces TaxID=2593676 RepID=UPI00368692A3
MVERMSYRFPEEPSSQRGTGPDCACRRWIPAEPEGPAIARRQVRKALEHWGLDEHTIEHAALLISELVTNAVEHGRHRGRLRMVWCHLRRTPAGLRLGVWGPVGDTVPQARRPVEDAGVEVATLAESGRGLLIVDALSQQWGTRRGRVSREVWAVIPARQWAHS